MRFIQAFVIAIASATAMAGVPIEKRACVGDGVCNGGGPGQPCCNPSFVTDAAVRNFSEISSSTKYFQPCSLQQANFLCRSIRVAVLFDWYLFGKLLALELFTSEP